MKSSNPSKQKTIPNKAHFNTSTSELLEKDSHETSKKSSDSKSSLGSSNELAIKLKREVPKSNSDIPVPSLPSLSQLSIPLNSNSLASSKIGSIYGIPNALPINTTFTLNSSNNSRQDSSSSGCVPPLKKRSKHSHSAGNAESISLSSSPQLSSSPLSSSVISNPEVKTPRLPPLSADAAAVPRDKPQGPDSTPNNSLSVLSEAASRHSADGKISHSLKGESHNEDKSPLSESKLKLPNADKPLHNVIETSKDDNFLTSFSQLKNKANNLDDRREIIGIKDSIELKQSTGSNDIRLSSPKRKLDEADEIKISFLSQQQQQQQQTKTKLHTAIEHYKRECSRIHQHCLKLAGYATPQGGAKNNQFDEISFHFAVRAINEDIQRWKYLRTHYLQTLNKDKSSSSDHHHNLSKLLERNDKDLESLDNNSQSKGGIYSCDLSRDKETLESDFTDFTGQLEDIDTVSGLSANLDNLSDLGSTSKSNFSNHRKPIIKIVKDSSKSHDSINSDSLLGPSEGSRVSGLAMVDDSTSYRKFSSDFRSQDWQSNFLGNSGDKGDSVLTDLMAFNRK